MNLSLKNFEKKMLKTDMLSKISGGFTRSGELATQADCHPDPVCSDGTCSPK